jgi:DNA-directed RNA polymerase subunit RPC12/RpoP
MKDDRDSKVVDISDLQPSQGDYICPYCGVFMLPISLRANESISSEVQCPSCGYRPDPTTDQTKHASKLVPKSQKK